MTKHPISTDDFDPSLDRIESPRETVSTHQLESRDDVASAAPGRTAGADPPFPRPRRVAPPRHRSVAGDAREQRSRGVAAMAAHGLRPTDLEQFARLGILPDLLEAAGVRRVTDPEARASCCRADTAATSRASSFPPSIPIHSPADQLRIAFAGIIQSLRTASRWTKTSRAYGDARHLYFPPRRRGVARPTPGCARRACRKREGGVVGDVRGAARPGQAGSGRSRSAAAGAGGADAARRRT